ncbi:MAG TPA: hypothetical protein VF731_05185 [Solirubrobacterales bacterium]
MAEQNPTGADRASADPASPATEDAQVESAVLGFVLEAHPDHLTPAELSLAVNPQPGDFASDDAIQRAVDTLVGAGLLHLAGGLAVPSRAALYFDRLRVG